MNAHRTMAALTILAAMLFLYGRVPGWSNDFCDPDLAGIAYGATDLAAGGSIYENCVETKPPGVYLIFAACFALFGHTLVPIYLLATLLHLLALLLIARLAGRSAGPVAGALAAWFYACLAIDSVAAANCPNYDSWMILAATFAFALLFDTDRPGRGRLLGGGALLAAAFLMKQQAALLGVGAYLGLALAPGIRWPRWWRQAAWLTLGGALPLAAVLLVWAVRGGLGTMLADLHPARLSTYVDAGTGAAAWAMARERTAEHLAGAWPAWLAVLAGVGLWLRATTRRELYARHLVLLLLALGAVLAGSRFYKHYLIILAAPLALTAGHALGLLDEALAHHRRRWVLPALVVAALLFTVRGELTQSTMALRAAARGEGLITGDMLVRFTRDDVNLETRHDDETLQHLGRYIASLTTPAEGLYVWPYEPQIYFWAERRAPTKHYMYFEVAANLPYKYGGWHGQLTAQVAQNRRRLLADLAASPPRFVVLPESATSWDHAFAELEAFVATRYERDPRAPGEHLRVFRLP